MKITYHPVHDRFQAEIPNDQYDVFLIKLGVLVQGIGARKLMLRPPQ
jgi:hypothetical protein